MSIQHLIDNGNVALAALREQAATAKATADRIAKEDTANRWHKELGKLYAVLPVELHSYVGYDATEPPSWRGLNDVWIDAIPGCRIRIFETDPALRFYPQKASQVVRNYYFDGGNAFRVEYENAYDDGYADPLAALAHAAEIAPANLEMEAEAKAQSEATAAKEALEAAPTDQEEIIHALIDEGKPVEAIARALLLIAYHLENR